MINSQRIKIFKLCFKNDESLCVWNSKIHSIFQHKRDNNTIDCRNVLMKANLLEIQHIRYNNNEKNKIY